MRDTPTPADTAKRRRWPLVTALSLASLTLLVVVLLPVAAQYGLRNWLLENGAQNVQIDDIDINPFTGVLLIEGLRIDVDSRNTLQADALGLNFAWQALARKRLTLSRITLSGIDMEIRQNDDGVLHIGGIPLPTTGAEADAKHAELQRKALQAEQDSPWGIGIEMLTLSDIDIDYRMPQLQIDSHIERLQLKRLASWTPAHGAQVSLQARVNGAPLQYTGSIAPFGDAVQVTGHIDLRNLRLDDFANIAAVVNELSGRISLQSDIDLKLATEGVQLDAKTDNLKFDELRLATAEARLQQQQIKWKGRTTLRQNAGLQLSSAGDISATGTALALPERKLDITQQGLDLALKIVIEQQHQPPIIEAQLDRAKITQLSVRSEAFPLTDVQTLSVNGLSLQKDGILAIARTRLQKLHIARPANQTPDKQATPALLGNGSLSLDELSLGNNGDLDIARINLEKANLYLQRAGDGRSNVDALLAAIARIDGTANTPADSSPHTPSAAQDDKQVEVDGPRLHIGRIRLADSAIVIEDAGTTPTTRIDIGITELNIDNIDNSSPEQTTNISTQGKFGRFGSYALSASAQPFSPQANGKLTGHINGIDLPRLSPYTARDLGFRLRSGTLDSDIDMAIAADQLSGKVKLVLHQLELIPIAERKISGDMTATSLNTSLNMLRDRNNTISIDVPLSGDINAPDFSIRDAFNQALMAGVKTGMMTYALLALQPYGTMVVVAKYAGEQISKLRLDPVTFAPASSVLDDTARNYLGKVAGMLAERPKVNVKVCGVAVAREAELLNDADKGKAGSGNASDDKGETEKRLKALARQRAITVREFLIEQAGGAAQQLVGCLPVIETGSDAVPRTDLLI